MVNVLIISFIGEQINQLAEFTKKAEEDQGEENLHELRVACKKLKAMYQVLSGITDGEFESEIHFADVDKLFKAVGTLRDLHVQLNLLEEVASANSIQLPDSFLNQYRENIQATEISIQPIIAEFNEEKMSESLDTASSLLEDKKEKSILKKIIKLLQKRLTQIRQLLPSRKNEEKMHLMRKRVKQVCYIVDLLKVIDQDKKYFKHYNRFKEAAELLGKWHDYAVLINPVMDAIDLSSEDETMLDLYACLKNEEREFLSKARRKLKKYFK